MEDVQRFDRSRARPLAAAFEGQSSPDSLIEYALVDAFTSSAFGGNQAAVVLLSEEKDPWWMQQVATEFNLSETAFLVPKRSNASMLPSGGQVNGYRESSENGHSETTPVDNEYHIRWFTPTREVPLCGHATLASSHVLFSSGLVKGEYIIFHSQSGKLIVRKVESVRAPIENGGTGALRDHKSGKSVMQLLEMNFPAIPVKACDFSEIKSLADTLSDVKVISVGRSGADDLIVELSSAEEVKNLNPRNHELVQCSGRGLHVTGKDSSPSDIDFASRSFFPKMNINEDPVCGSAHCALTSYWAAKLGKDCLEAFQASKRGGRLSLRNDSQNSRVYLTGEAVITMSGVLLI